MYQFISVDEPREQYAALVRSRRQQRLERQLARNGRRTPPWWVRLTQRFPGRRRVERRKIIGRVVGA